MAVCSLGINTERARSKYRVRRVPLPRRTFPRDRSTLVHGSQMIRTKGKIENVAITSQHKRKTNPSNGS